tara:strand:+ start:1303 stop:1710 length:408 start_codon:yes stop_codon:yes gene_type:complete
MAYYSQERKQEAAPKVKAILKKYGVKASLSVHHNSTVVLNIKSGKLDFIADFNTTVSDQPGGFRNGNPATTYISVNPYHFQTHFSGECLQFLTEVFAALSEGNHNNSDIQTDYFDVGWYIDVNIGQWDKPYLLEA